MKTFRDENGDEWVSVSNITGWETLAIKRKEQIEADRLEMLASLKAHKAEAVARGSKHAHIWDNWIEAKENER